MKTAIVIAIANQKGGVAKTTSTANLGAGLALRGFRTLLIDFDPQENLTQFLGFRTGGQQLFPTVGDWIMGKKSSDHVIRQTAYENLDLIPSNESLKGTEMDMQKDIFKTFKYLQKSVESVRELYDFILIDTVPSFSLLFVNSIAACDCVLVPVKLEYLSMQGLNLLRSKIEDVSENIKPIKVLGIFGTFYRNSVKECENCLNELRKVYEQETFSTIIHLNTKLAESAAYAKPIQHYDKSCQGYEDYEALTVEVLNRCSPKEHFAESSMVR